MMQPKIVVSGLPRSGTSMMMKILERGGLKPVIDDRKKPTNANPNGFYEYGGMEFFPEWWLEKEGDCIKVLIPQVKRLNGDCKYIFMHRDLEETADSFNCMHRADIWAFNNLMHEAMQWAKDKNVIHLNYNRIMENPEHELSKIKDIIPNFQEALKVIDPKLYRTKKPTGRAITKEDLEKKKEGLQNEIKHIDKLLEAFREVL